MMPLRTRTRTSHRRLFVKTTNENNYIFSWDPLSWLSWRPFGYIYIYSITTVMMISRTQIICLINKSVIDGPCIAGSAMKICVCVYHRNGCWVHGSGLNRFSLFKCDRTVALAANSVRGCHEFLYGSLPPPTRSIDQHAAWTCCLDELD